MVLRHRRHPGTFRPSRLWRAGHVLYANEPAVREEGSAALRLKMADGESSLGTGLSSASEMDEPAAKRSKMSPGTDCGLKGADVDQLSCVSAGTESLEAAVNCPQPAEKEAKPVMAVEAEQAPAAALGGDNNGLVLPEQHRPAVRLDHSAVLGTTEEGADFHEHADFPSNGLAVTPDHNNDEDDRSSHASSSDWTPQPQIGSYSFIQQHIRDTDPRTILRDLLPETVLPPDLDDMTLWQIIINISEPPKRKKRKDINTLEDVVRLLHESKRILVLTGAGVSVSCGIPDFRSRDGIYARLAVDFPDLPDPQAMFDIEYFRRDPRPFFKFAKEIYPGQFQPSPCHKFISMLDKRGKLLRNYTQNIDTLEQVAGVQRIIQCHGSFATASCLVCKHTVDCEAIREDIFNQVVPHCPRCPDIPLAIMKPDIVFFGENLPEMFHRAMKQDKDEVDLLIVIGSSLKVRPVALIPNSIPHEVPQVLINREQLPHLNFDVELLGDCDVIVNELCHRLAGDFEQLCFNTVRLTEITEKPPRLPEQPPSEALPASSDAAQEEQRQHSTDSAIKPSEETESLNVTETAHNNVTPPEPCPNSQSPSEEMAESSPPSEETAESSELPAEDTPKEEAADVKNQTSSLEYRRRCWMSRINRSPISKRLETGEYLFQTPNHYVFHGAEVYSDSEDETSSSCGSDSDESECSADEVEEDSEPEESDTLAADGETCLRDTIEHTIANKAKPSVQTDNTSEKTPSTTHL
ncbi:LOW QUALITY PROTEIN: NAD-dependent protein deacetylase sirtuin-1 [Hippoglossus stenolepis]|uniref:LOW QUALITY PROTEIN: NAD-dependent protein deacetylase sirtuin-1 n=1 Tax=Hippoglossus stenolepis TaxID=195615 RepID=UPI001FAF91D5|nr:LOW QUALITY PROTEIN: NAD-dependent protein deacetylase sirtuin-1 [Hippoglossus stenolepis]